MPMCFIEAPQGVRIDAKRTLVEETAAALEAAYRLNDTRIFLREYPPENVAQDGRLQSGIRPVCFVEGPVAAAEVKRTLVARISAAVAGAYGDQVDAREIMVLINEYPLGNAGSGGRLQSENPEVVEAVKVANA